MRKGRGLPLDRTSTTSDALRPLVNVDLPINASIPSEYVPDKNMRLRLYRRIADLRSLSEIEAIFEEFKDRFGIPPKPVRNLLYQLKIKLLAEMTDINSVNVENSQIVLRFKDEKLPANLPDFGQHVRIGKTALWISYKSIPNWSDDLLALLNTLLSNKVR